MIFPSVWQALNHNTILDSVEKALQVKLSNLLIKRNSYINRVYELEEYDSRKRIIVKFYRPDRWTKAMILEEHQFLKELENKEVPVIPPLVINDQTLFSFDNMFFSVFPKKGGRALDEFDQAAWEEIGRLIARIHLAGAQHKSSQRTSWRPAVATKQHLSVLYASAYLLPEFKPALERVAEHFISKADPLFDGYENILLHGDCHKGNLIHRPGEGIYIVDFDDICFGPAMQDLWLLLPDIPEKCENELSWLLKGYEVFRPFDKRSLELVPFLRGMRIIHFAAWLSVQSKEDDFEHHFPKAGTPSYWRELINNLQEI